MYVWVSTSGAVTHRRCITRIGVRWESVTSEQALTAVNNSSHLKAHYSVQAALKELGILTLSWHPKKHMSRPPPPPAAAVDL